MQSFKYDVFNIKTGELKFNAFFSYLKSFSEAGLDTLQKLESEFHRQIKKKAQEKDVLGVMKKILSSYQIFVLEIKDSCDFVQIPEFGFCIGKTFVQMLKIIKWFLRSWLKTTSKYEEMKVKVEQQQSQKKAIGVDPNAVCAFCEELIRNNPYAKDLKGKRKGLAISDINSEIRSARKQHQMERSHLNEVHEQVIQRYTSKEIAGMKYIGEMSEVDILNQKHAVQKLEFSNKDNVLEEILNEFNLKTQAIARFVNHNQIMGLQDSKMCGDTSFENFEEQIRQKIAQRFQEAKQKFKQLVASKLEEYQKIKKGKMVDKQIQTQHYESFDRERLESKIKHLNVTIRQLKNELDSQKTLTENLKKLLESKSIEFQEQFLNYRRNHLLKGNNSKNLLKSLKSLKDIFENNEDKKQNIENTSISKINQSNGQAGSIKKKSTNGIFKEKTAGKKKMSIKFTLKNEGASQDDKSQIYSENKSILGESQVSNQLDFVETATQTQANQNIRLIQSAASTPLDKKFFLIDHDKAQSKGKKTEFSRVKQKGSSSKHSSRDLYAYVKSKVYDKVQTPRTPSLAPKFPKTNTSNQFYSLVRKLQVSYGRDSEQMQRQLVACQRIDKQPIFTQISCVIFNSDDVFNLYLSLKNAQNYQCLLYRNAIFSNVNPKRVVNYKKKLNASQVDWCFRKQYDQADDVEKKTTAILYHQISHLKRKEWSCYQQIKTLLRSPTQLCNKTEIISLQKCHEEKGKDIDHSELKKMLNIIFKFHGKCIGQEKNVICGHLVHFYRKIGIKFE